MASNICNFCGKNKTDIFHISLITKLKSSNIISERYPNLCSKCYTTYSSIGKLETFLDENDITCTKCGKTFTHFEAIFDGKGHTSYCTCESCGLEYAVSITSDFFVKLTQISHLEVTPSITH